MAWKYVQYDGGKYRTTDQGGGGGEENIIESISLNGVDVPPDANKNVALTVITNTVNNLTNYYLKSETYTQAQVDSLINAAKTGRFIVVAVLPTTNIDTTAIYLVPKMPSEQSNTKDEYINLDGTTAGWEKIGDTTIDLSDYVTDTELQTALSAYATTASLATVATSGSYNDLSNKPSIPEDIGLSIVNGKICQTYTVS